MTNPLFELDSLPEFSKIKAEHIVPAVTEQIQQNRNHLNKLLQEVAEPSWQNLIEPTSIKDRELDNLWSPVSHINSVANSNEWREQYEQCLPMLTEYAAEVGQNQALFQHYQQLAKQPSLTAPQKKVIKDGLLGFKLSGIDLSDEKQKRYKELKKLLSKLSSDFSNHVLDATMSWKKLITEASTLEGIPKSSLEQFAQKAQDEEQQGYLLDLQFPTYHAILTYAKNRELRKTLYRAFSTRASEFSDNKEWNNGPLISEILILRQELAELLGFESYAHYSTATKMAQQPEKVMAFLQQLVAPSLKAATEEIATLQTFAKELDGVTQLEAWDLSYYSELLRQQAFDISQEALRPYFPEAQVRQTLFEVAEKLFAITIEPNNEVDVWHKDVSFYDIRDSHGAIIARFYLDLYARQHKRGGAWMDSCRDRIKMGHIEQTPVAYLTCNFAGPTKTTPALLTHDDVLTLFHEFGHGLHHMLTQIDESQISGINGVEWDAVELPSQLMENYAYHEPTLRCMAKHYETGETLDDVSIQKLIQARSFQAGMFMLRQLEFALFDFRIHLEFDGDNDCYWQDILAQVRAQVNLIKVPEFNRFACGFSHIFAGGYAAGYYSYKWAEVLSADVWEYFEESGPISSATGSHYRNTILGKGGSKQAMELFVDFRGREPTIEPLLKQQGIL